MTLQEHDTKVYDHDQGARPQPGHQDIEFEIGALSSRHGLPLDVARMIVERCGKDMHCIDNEAREWKLLK